MATRATNALRTGRVEEKRGGYPAGNKPANQLKPPPASVVKRESPPGRPAASGR